MRHRTQAQSIVELPLLVLMLGVLALGLSSVWAVVQVHLGLVAVAEEAARAAALAPSAALVEQRGIERGTAVASGYTLKNGSLLVSVDAGEFRPGGRVTARAEYRLTSQDVPAMVAGGLSLQREQVEVVPGFRSIPP